MVLQLVLRALPLGVMTFVMSALLNILPQLQLLEHHERDKDWLLNAMLLTAMLAAVGGVWVGRRCVPSLRRSRRRVACFVGALGVTGGALAATFVATPIVLYGAAIAVGRFGSNLLMQWLDSASHVMAGPSLRQRNDRFTMVARFTGILLAPLVFALWHEGNGIEVAIVVVTVVTGIVAWPMSSVRIPEMGSRTTGDTTDISTERRVLRHAFFMIAGLYLLGVNLIYLLRDRLHMDHPVLRGAVLSTLFFASTVAVIAVQPMLASRWPALSIERLLRRLWVPPALLITACALLVAFDAIPFVAVVGGVMLVGASNGSLQLTVRDQVTHAVNRGATGLLADFNNLANVSALLAFSLGLTAAAIARWASLPYPRVLLIAIMLTSGASAMFLPRTSATGKGG